MIAETILIAAALLAATAPAIAHDAAPAPAPVQTPASIPEPGDAGLFLLGAVGIAVGRWMHARRARKQKSDDGAE